MTFNASHKSELQLCEELFLDCNIERLNDKLENLYNLALVFYEYDVNFLKELYNFLKVEVAFVHDLYTSYRKTNFDLLPCTQCDITLRSFAHLQQVFNTQYKCCVSFIFLRIRRTLKIFNIVINELATCISLAWYFDSPSHWLKTFGDHDRSWL